MAGFGAASPEVVAPSLRNNTRHPRPTVTAEKLAESTQSASNDIGDALRALEALQQGHEPDPQTLLSGLLAMEALQTQTLAAHEASVVAAAQRLIHLASIGHLDPNAPDRGEAAAVANDLAAMTRR